jgi:anaerobic selenocysteine-containing dehydrogenase
VGLLEHAQRDRHRRRAPSHCRDTRRERQGGQQAGRPQRSWGDLAQKLYSPDKPTRDRLQTPQLRVDDEVVQITWDEAIAVAGDISLYVPDRYGEMAWGM